jgi:hypothetical protein
MVGVVAVVVTVVVAAWAIGCCLGLSLVRVCAALVCAAPFCFFQAPIFPAARYVVAQPLSPSLGNLATPAKKPLCDGKKGKSTFQPLPLAGLKHLWAFAPAQKPLCNTKKGENYVSPSSAGWVQAPVSFCAGQKAPWKAKKGKSTFWAKKKGKSTFSTKKKGTSTFSSKKKGKSTSRSAYFDLFTEGFARHFLPSLQILPSWR